MQLSKGTPSVHKVGLGLIGKFPLSLQCTNAHKLSIVVLIRSGVTSLNLYSLFLTVINLLKWPLPCDRWVSGSVPSWLALRTLLMGARGTRASFLLTQPSYLMWSSLAWSKAPIIGLRLFPIHSFRVGAKFFTSLLSWFVNFMTSWLLKKYLLFYHCR